MAFNNLFLASDLATVVDSLQNTIGMSLFDEEIDQVIFRTNEFLTSGANAGGPFWFVMQFAMTLGALFGVIMCGGMAYKMLVKGEPFDPLKIMRVFAIASVMFWWYPEGGVLDTLAYVPNAIGSWTHDMYELEAIQVNDTYNQLAEPLDSMETKMNRLRAGYEAKLPVIDDSQTKTVVVDALQTPTEENKLAAEAHEGALRAFTAGILVCLDRIIMLASIILFRIGWWGTIYCQQILLGMLTIFGPIQWAFSILPKWEGAWAKWITRYLTVHFYGAMLYFVGFYVLLLFDIVFSIQLEMLQNITQSDSNFMQYAMNSLLTAGYLLVASVVSMRCLNLVPDLAAWMIPEGDTTFSARNFGEGVATSVKQTGQSALGHIIK